LLAILLAQSHHVVALDVIKEKMKNKEILTIVSPGTQKRNFTHIEADKFTAKRMFSKNILLRGLLIKY